MNTFNLERALAGDKVVTRDGDEVNQFFVVNTENGPTLTGYVVSGDTIKAWEIDGCYFDTLRESRSDLFMAPKKLNGFVNVYAESVVYGHYDTRLQADGNCNKDTRIACIDLSQFNVGEGL